MANESLVHLASLLGQSCIASTGNHDVDEGTMNEHLCEESDDRKRAASPSREEVQVKASTLMSRPLVATINSAEFGLSSESLDSPQQIMLNNIMESFYQLVDARIRAYSKILRNHYLSISNVKWDDDASGGLYSADSGAQNVEYKLRALLEFGANLSFGSITTSFTPIATTDVEQEVGDKARTARTSSSSLPVVLTVNIEPTTFRDSNDDVVDDRTHPMLSTSPRFAFSSTPSSLLAINKVSFQAPGLINGTFAGMFSSSFGPNGNNAVDRKDAAAMTAGTDSAIATASPGKSFPSSSLSFENVVSASIEVDCEVLLSNMMEEASRVVAMVVELTNEAWAKRQQEDALSTRTTAVGAAKESNLLDQFQSVKSAAKCNHGSNHKASSVSHSPKLGAKKVSEVSFDPLKLEESNEDQVPHDDDDDRKPASSMAFWDYHQEDNDSEEHNQEFEGIIVDPPPNQEHQLDFSDEENLNPFISAEKACHIVDYVFGELDDEIIAAPPPRPTKKARVDEY